MFEIHSCLSKQNSISSYCYQDPSLSNSWKKCHTSLNTPMIKNLKYKTVQWLNRSCLSQWYITRNTKPTRDNRSILWLRLWIQECSGGQRFLHTWRSWISCQVLSFDISETLRSDYQSAGCLKNEIWNMHETSDVSKTQLSKTWWKPRYLWMFHWVYFQLILVDKYSLIIWS